MGRDRGLSIAVIGAGNWGSSLIAALKAADVEPREVVGRDNFHSTDEELSAGSRGQRRAKLDARVIWICVPDAAIAEVAEKIAKRRGNMRGQIVVHSSGVLPATVLDAARKAGARIASVHPVMSFPTRDVVPLAGVMFGVEARDAAVRRALFTLVRRMGGAPFALQAETKALYHAAGVMASPLMVSALVAAMETAELAGMDRKTSEAWVRALASATVANVFVRGATQSFSGPFARGDAGTIDLHLRALAEHPILADVYRSLARHAISALPVKNRPALEKAIEAGSGRSRKIK